LLGAMNRFLDRHSIPDSLRRRAREYLYQAANTSNAKEDEERLLDLSPTLRGDLILSSSVFAWLWKVTIFRGFEVELLVQIPQSMTAFLYAPYELPEQMRFYILNKGVVMFGGKVYTSGSFWGQDMIVSNPTYQNTANTARCLTFAETYSIDADTLYEIAEEFPTATRLLKTRAALFAFERMVRIELEKMEGEDRNACVKLGLVKSKSDKKPGDTLMSKIGEISVPKYKDVSSRNLIAANNSTSFAEASTTSPPKPASKAAPKSQPPPKATRSRLDVASCLFNQGTSRPRSSAPPTRTTTRCSTWSRKWRPISSR